jgi:predicted DNA-binding transcriptional regulator AlpA
VPKPSKSKSAADIPLARAGDEFLTTKQAAEILQRSEKTLEYWRTRPSGPRFYKQGRVVRYLRSDVLAWGMRHCIETRDTAA